MAEKGDPWLLSLFVNDREHKNGKVKPYLENDSIGVHEAGLAQR